MPSPQNSTHCFAVSEEGIHPAAGVPSPGGSQPPPQPPPHHCVCPPPSEPPPSPSLHSIPSVPLPEPLGQAAIPPAGFWWEKELPCGPPSRTPLRSLFALQPGGPSLPPGPESGVRGPAPRPTLCTDAAAEHIALQTRPEQLGGARPSARLHVNIWADVIPAPLNAVN